MKKISFYLIGLWLNVFAYLLPERVGKRAFYLFCYPTRIPMKDHQLEFLDGAKFETLKTSRDTIQIYRWGTGQKKILFLHGWRSHTFRWKKYIESLSHKEYSIYALDAPGHGLSTGNYLNIMYYGEVIEQFVNRLNGVDTIVSHSVGGFSSLFALHQTQTLQVSNLVLMGTPGQAKEFVEYYRSMLGLSDRTMRLMVEYFKYKIGFDPSYFSGPDFAKSVSIPGLIIHDEEDLEAPIHNAIEIHKSWPASSMIITKGLGHNLRSREVIGYLQKFLESTGEKHLERLELLEKKN
jgi:pimeloyl-ACP methyl ester carboxylesterase